MRSSVACRPVASSGPTAAGGPTATLSASRWHGSDHLHRLHLQRLTLATDIQTHEVTQMRQFNVTAQLKFEGQRLESIRPWQLATLITSSEDSGLV